MSDLINEQQPPKECSGDTWKLVIQDMENRRLLGIEKYGVPLQPFNGRDSLIDAYQEILDLCVYIRNEIEKRNQELPEITVGSHIKLNTKELQIEGEWKVREIFNHPYLNIVYISLDKVK